uniref:Glycine N-acyltransferase-like protein n=1 Tax=Salvator merianae TaxID=96440 RepID=A0A8D0BVA5_SALMN
MLVLGSQDALHVLKKELSSCFPESLKVYGAVLNICRGNAFHQEIVVDSWPCFQVAVARLQREKTSATDYFSQSYAVFYKDLDAYEKFVRDTEAIDWKQEFLLHGLQQGVDQVSRSLAAPKRFSATMLTRTQVFVLRKSPNLPATAPMSGSELKLSSLNSTHLTLLNETWSVGGTDQSLQYLKQLVCCFPSACLLDAEGSPISWVMLDQFGALTHAYTMPAHRGKGYIQLVIAALAKELQNLDYPAYGDVLENNTSMCKALQRLDIDFPPCFLTYDLHQPLPVQ